MVKFRKWKTRKMSIRSFMIISGGQTGADRGGLEAAKKLGIATGGWAPRGYVTENGRDLSLKDFELQTTRTWRYPPRTRLNVKESDATVVFGDLDSPGCRLTVSLVKKMKKPWIHVPYEGRTNQTIRRSSLMLQQFIEDHQNVKVLNVAGNRESKNPGIQEFTEAVLVRAFSVLV